MKNRTLQLALVAVVFLSTIPITAQSIINETVLRANIPFAFVAGGVAMPPGEYRIYHPGNPWLIVIEKKDGTANSMTYVHPSPIAPSKSCTKLLFHKYGGQYFLAEVWTERNQEVHQCFKCRKEQSLIAQARRSTAVTIAAMR